MRAKTIVLLIVATFLASMLATFGGLLYRQTLRYIDFEADRFGFPYYWIEHVTVTLAGRTDFWNIELWNFVIDVILFFAIIGVILYLGFIWKSRRGQFGVH